MVAEFLETARVAGKMILMSPEERRAFETAELRVRSMMPQEYRDTYEQVEPVSMGSAGLKFGPDGRVAWNDIWGDFCDLALAGGPPHKGKLLRAASREEIEADPVRYRQVVEEICRGIRMVTDLAVNASPVPGWVRADCDSAVTAGWLARAIVMENVSARCEGTWLDLPAGPTYRIEKEIKNVITSIAKTGHYWLEHVSSSRQREVEELFAAMEAESPLIQPALVGFDFQAEADAELRAVLAEKIRRAAGLEAGGAECEGWLGLVCPSVKGAIRMMRLLMAGNVFARREDVVLYVPVNPVSDPAGDTVARAVARAQAFARVRGLE